MSRKWSLPILPTALPLYLIEPVDAELEASIISVEVSPMAAALAVPVVVSPESHSHQNAMRISSSQFSTVKTDDVVPSKKEPVHTVLWLF